MQITPTIKGNAGRNRTGETTQQRTGVVFPNLYSRRSVRLRAQSRLALGRLGEPRFRPLERETGETSLEKQPLSVVRVLLHPWV